MVTKVLVIVGAINWGLVGAFNYDLVAGLLGAVPMAMRVVYIVIGLAGVLMLVKLVKKCSSGCGAGGSCCGGSCGPQSHA
ncbi:MAG TPA: DUF378 domain-containing protein [Candidatus Peribacterales bacterium]|nr:DUF378 domain-containing protein [Candidatus Peribacterales bacterium]